MTPQLNDLQKNIGIKFKDPAILEQALIHRSYINENKALKLESNERYEFLGDAVLELWASAKLFHLFPQYPEGDLTNLRSMAVRTENLADISKLINLSDYIKLSKGEETHGGRQNVSILADGFESVIGAIYLDSGMVAVDQFLTKFLEPSIQNLSQQKIYKDPKSLFQEIAQAKQGITPNYKVISESGPDHQKIFEVGVYIGDKLITTGSGNSKQRAEEDAATKATQLSQV
ncbi:ribonuclease III [Candidatus Shapirobacteria bacterium]|nr:ribonuclease III [Candidatus Shapirobacteria bacterium]